MMTFVSFLTHNLYFQGAVSGALAAAAVDLHAFAQWHSFDEARTYSWSTALFRWFQGAVLGALSAAGLGLVG